MLREERTKAIVGITAGLLLWCLIPVVVIVFGLHRLEGIGEWAVNTAFGGVGVLLFVWGCWHWVTGKGYSRWFGLLGLIPFLGFIILLALPDKHEGERATHSILGAFLLATGYIVALFENVFSIFIPVTRISLAEVIFMVVAAAYCLACSGYVIFQRHNIILRIVAVPLLILSIFVAPWAIVLPRSGGITERANARNAEYVRATNEERRQNLKASGEGNIRRDTAGKLAYGMSKEQVEAIMGTPSKVIGDEAAGTFSLKYPHNLGFHFVEGSLIDADIGVK